MAKTKKVLKTDITDAIATFDFSKHELTLIFEFIIDTIVSTKNTHISILRRVKNH